MPLATHSRSACRRHAGAHRARVAPALGACASLCCALLLASWRAHAQPHPKLRVVATANGCADAREIEARLHAHDPELALASAGEVPALTARFSFEPGDTGIKGRLNLETSASSQAHAREIEAGACADVAEALVLVTLVLVQDASSPGAGPQPEAPSPQRAVAVPRPDAAEAGGPAVGWRGLMAASAAAMDGQLPGWAPRFQLGAGLELARAARTVLASSRLSAAFADGLSKASAAGGAEFWSITGRLEACGPRLSWRRLGADACGLLELGRVQGSGSGADREAAASAQWVAAGGLARAFWQLHRRVRLELELAFFASLRPAEFYVEGFDGSRERAWSYAPWGMSGALGVAVPFS